MIEKQIWPLLDRYFSGVASADEAEQVARWVGDDPERKRYLESIEQVWMAGGVPSRPNVDIESERFDATQAFARVRDRMNGPVFSHMNHAADSARRTAWASPVTATTQDGVASPTVHQPSYGRGSGIATRRRAWSFGMAAIFCVLATMGVLSYRTRTENAPSRQSTDLRTYATGKGQRTEILLPDGTRAVLSVESRMQIPSNYGDRTRDIYLEGEAFFEVTHDERNPFRVHAAGTLAEDLGTEFSVRAYRDEHPTVVVASGLVALRGDTSALSHRVLLSPGQLGRWDPVRHITAVHDVDANAYLAWMHGRLDFKHAPLSHVARELERWYDIQIVIADSSLVNADLTTTIKNQPLGEVLDMIAKALDVQYTRRGTQVVFSVRTLSK